VSEYDDLPDTGSLPHDYRSNSFLANAVTARLLTNKQAQAAFADLPPDIRSDDRRTAERLVLQKQLTRWQADRLLRGKTKDFFVGQYKILDFIGKGGGGRVFHAEHKLMRQPVALKLMFSHPSHPQESTARLAREIALSAQLRHPNIVATLYADMHGPHVYMAMEYVVGCNLMELVKHKHSDRESVSITESWLTFNVATSSQRARRLFI